MAKGNVVREDVVQIGFELEDDGLSQMNKEVQNLKQELGLVNGDGLEDVSREARAASSAADDAASGIRNIASEAQTASNSVGDITGNMQETSGAAQKLQSMISNADNKINSAKQAMSEFVGKIKEAASAGLDKLLHPVETIKTALGSAKKAAGEFVTKLRDIGKSKLDSVKNSLSQIKNVLTGGKSGLSGFAQTLKNIGKISLGGVLSGLKGIGSFAKSGFSALGNGIKAAGSGIKGLVSGIKNIGSSGLSALTSGFQQLPGLIGGGSNALTGMIGKLGSLKMAGAAAVAAVAAIGVAVTKAAVSNYADYEQLKGGVETLFGAGGQTLEKYANKVGKTTSEASAEFNNLMAAQNDVLNNANEAYKTCGLSANEYMETVTSFSASLVQSLGGDTQKAAESANKALVDMSDNANKMGTDMGMIQNAYQGFAKQNYTMLDNLKLGYGGTQEEMKRLLSDAQKLTGVKYDISNFNDVVQAIHAIQDNLGIAGTTSKEAATTISGSANMMKAAWQNVLTSVAGGGADLGKSLQSLGESVQSFLGNVTPVIKTALANLPQLFTGLISQIGPLLVSLAPTLGTSLVDLITSALGALVNLLPQLAMAAANLVVGLAQGLAQNAPALITGFMQLGPSMLQGLMNAIPVIVSAIPSIIRSLITGILGNLPQIIQSGIQMMVSLAQGLINGIVYLIQAIPEICSAIWDGIKSIDWIDLGKQVITAIWEGIKSLGSAVWNGIKSIFGGGDGGQAELNATGHDTGASYAQSVTAGINSVPADTSSIASGLNVDLTSTGVQSAGTWNTGFNQSLGADGAAVASTSSNLQSSLNVDLTQAGTTSASSWSAGLNTGLSTESVTTTAEQVKATLNMDLTAQGDFSGNTWAYGFNSVLSNEAANAAVLMEPIKTALNIDLTDQSANMTATIQNGCATVVSVVSTTVSGLTMTVATGGSAILTSTKNTMTGMTQAAQSGMSSFNSAIRSGMQTAVTTVQNGANSIKSTLSNINLKSTGENVITGFLNGLKSKASSLMSYAQTLANNITQTMNKALDIGSPSKVTYEIGQFTVQGLINSFKDSIPRVRSTTDQLVNAYTPQTDAAVVNNSTSSRSETNYYSPNFSLTISGSRDDRDMERKVKRWIKEAMTSMIESEMRKAGQGAY